ncbi:MAG: putative toxin-antitoxin system toxin component, PIN family, partial [Patescibacteria group bacterium]
MNLRVVLDTNVWISGLFWYGAPKEVTDRFAADKITPCFSIETFAEWEEKVLLLAEKSHRMPAYVTYRRLIARRAVLVNPDE